MGLHKAGFGGRTGKNFGRFIFAFFNSIDPNPKLEATTLLR
jgi:hypothetical protein